jgi:hypothetical protein
MRLTEVRAMGTSIHKACSGIAYGSQYPRGLHGSFLASAKLFVVVVGDLACAHGVGSTALFKQVGDGTVGAPRFCRQTNFARAVA